jgi:hypothetical protein
LLLDCAPAGAAGLLCGCRETVNRQALRAQGCFYPIEESRCVDTRGAALGQCLLYLDGASAPLPYGLGWSVAVEPPGSSADGGSGGRSDGGSDGDSDRGSDGGSDGGSNGGSNGGAGGGGSRRVACPAGSRELSLDLPFGTDPRLRCPSPGQQACPAAPRRSFLHRACEAVPGLAPVDLGTGDLWVEGTGLRFSVGEAGPDGLAPGPVLSVLCRSGDEVASVSTWSRPWLTTDGAAALAVGRCAQDSGPRDTLLRVELDSTRQRAEATPICADLTGRVDRLDVARRSDGQVVAAIGFTVDTDATESQAGIRVVPVDALDPVACPGDAISAPVDRQAPPAGVPDPGTLPRPSGAPLQAAWIDAQLAVSRAGKNIPVTAVLETQGSGLARLRLRTHDARQQDRLLFENAGLGDLDLARHPPAMSARDGLVAVAAGGPEVGLWVALVGFDEAGGFFDVASPGSLFDPRSSLAPSADPDPRRPPLAVAVDVVNQGVATCHRTRSGATVLGWPREGLVVLGPGDRPCALSPSPPSDRAVASVAALYVGDGALYFSENTDHGTNAGLPVREPTALPADADLRIEDIVALQLVARDTDYVALVSRSDGIHRSMIIKATRQGRERVLSTSVPSQGAVFAAPRGRPRLTVERHAYGGATATVAYVLETRIDEMGLVFVRRSLSSTDPTESQRVPAADQAVLLGSPSDDGPSTGARSLLAYRGPHRNDPTVSGAWLRVVGPGADPGGVVLRRLTGDSGFETEGLRLVPLDAGGLALVLRSAGEPVQETLLFRLGDSADEVAFSAHVAGAVPLAFADLLAFPAGPRLLAIEEQGGLLAAPASSTAPGLQIGAWSTVPSTGPSPGGGSATAFRMGRDRTVLARCGEPGHMTVVDDLLRPLGPELPLGVTTDAGGACPSSPVVASGGRLLSSSLDPDRGRVQLEIVHCGQRSAAGDLDEETVELPLPQLPLPPAVTTVGDGCGDCLEGCCVKGICRYDVCCALCSGGYVCMGPFCVNAPPPPCTSDSCPAGQVCVPEAGCLDPGRCDQPDQSCRPPFICLDAVCVLPEPCRLDSDCPLPLVCRDERCVP